MSKVFKVEKNKLVFSEVGFNAVAVGAYMAYNREFANELQSAEITKKFFYDYLDKRPDFQKLPPLAKERLVLFFMEKMIRAEK